MKALEQLQNVPENGIVIRQEGAIVRLFFDIEPAPEIPSLDGEEAAFPEDLYQCYNVDVAAPANYGNIIAAIVNDKYSADDVQALTANYFEAKDPESDLTDEKRAEYINEWNDFQAWRAKAKEIATYVVNQLQY